MRFVVRQHRPLREFALATLSIALLGVAGWLLYDYGHWRHIYERMAASAEQRDLWDISRATERDNIELRDRVAVLERAAQIDQQAYRELQRLVGDLQDEALTLREELEFYRGVIARSDREQDLRIQGVRFRPVDDAGRYAFQVVLTRVGKGDSLAKGGVDMSFEGRRGGHTMKLAMPLVTDDRVERLPFEFKHFSRVEGVVALPADFTPVRIRVVLQESGGGGGTIVRTFDWTDVLERRGGRQDVG